MLQLENVGWIVESVADETQLHWRDFWKHTKLDALSPLICAFPFRVEMRQNHYLRRGKLAGFALTAEEVMGCCNQLTTAAKIFLGVMGCRNQLTAAARMLRCVIATSLAPSAEEDSRAKVSRARTRNEERQERMKE